MQTLSGKLKATCLSFAQLGMLSLVALPAHAEEFSHQEWDELLQAHVQWPEPQQTSCVDYANFDQAKLQSYLQQVAAVERNDFENWTEGEQLAFLINTYNAYTVQHILSAYPNIDSIKDLGSLFSSAWKKKRFALFGETVHLDHIEHDLIRPVYNQPHVHAALVCAAKGCPPLQSHAYTGEAVGEQMELAFREFLRSNKNYLSEDEKTLYISSIFKWFDEDFPPNVHSYLVNYSADFNSTNSVIEKARIKHLSYDWSLNSCS